MNYLLSGSDHIVSTIISIIFLFRRFVLWQQCVVELTSEDNLGIVKFSGVCRFFVYGKAWLCVAQTTWQSNQYSQL